MTQAVAARRDGDAFQARIFWRKAACLLVDSLFLGVRLDEKCTERLPWSPNWRKASAMLSATYRVLSQ